MKHLTLCESLGLELKKEMWFSRFHRWFRAGGICVELVKIPTNSDLTNDYKEATGVNTNFVEPLRGGAALGSSSIQVLQSEPVEGETSISTRTRSIVSSN